MEHTEVSADNDEVPEWALRALRAAQEAGAEQRAANSVKQRPGSTIWPLLLDAAVVSTFLPRDVAPEEGLGPQRADSEARLLDYAEATHTIAGPKWQLRREVRTEVLRSAWGTPELEGALRRTKDRFNDAVSIALRDKLEQVETRPEEMTLPGLEALRVASAALGDLELPRPAVSVAELDRLIRRRRMIEQFERICGRDFRHDVVGRDEELEKLNAYVGVIDASTTLHNLKRAAASVRRVFSGRRPLAIWGTGGVGKTTLLSRFMLEHIDSAERSYPFAYLDFDRPSLSPRDYFGLLAEICDQFIAQFEGLERLLRHIRNEALRRQSSSLASGSVTDFPWKMIDQFRDTVDKFLAGQESRLEWARPVLIVMDTFEVVQYDYSQVVHLERFFNALTHRGWPRLRLIVSGRKHLLKFGEKTEELELMGLTISGADELIQRLAGKAAKPISLKTARDLAEILAVKRDMLSYARVHPLRIRMVGQIFADSPIRDGEELGNSLIAELRSGTPLAPLIEGILVRRIIGHVRDARVRALADPGLVVRRITPEVIRLVMARGTPKPGHGEAVQVDAIDFPAWEIGEGEAKEIWEAFAREVSLVVHDGQALRHRQDVRAEMLPLIRARSPQQFEHLHFLAYDYFRERASRSDASAAEAIYHGLWSGAPLEDIDRLWTESSSLEARIDPDEFGIDALQGIYLKSRNDEKLSTQEAQRLPRKVAAKWAGRFGERFLYADDAVQDFALIRVATGSQLEDAPTDGNLEAIAARLLYRAGAWQDCRDLIWTVADRWLAQPAPGREEARASTIRLAVHLSAKAGQRSPSYDQIAPSVDLMDPIARVEVHANLILAARYAREGSEYLAAQKSLQSAIRSVPIENWSRSRLRLAMLASDKPVRRLVAHWVRLTDDVSWLTDENQHRDDGMWSDIRAVLGMRGSIRNLDIQTAWEKRKEAVCKQIEASESTAMSVRRLMVYDHTDWLVPFMNCLRRSQQGPGSDRIASTLKRSGFNFSETVSGGLQTGAEDRLLTLADRFQEETKLEEPPSLLPDWKGRRTEPGVLYPNSLTSLARALLDWHQFLLRRVLP